jgi:hypothetical protein
VNFPCCPLPEIYEALDAIASLENQRASEIADPISKILSTQIDWKESRSEFLKYSNPSGYRLLVEAAKESIDIDAAELYLSLLREGKVPAWASCDIDLKTMKMALE